MNKTHGEITMAVLDTIGKMAGSASDICLAILTSKYGASSGQLMRRAEQFENARTRRRLEQADRMRVASLLYKLKRDGLVKERVAGSKKILVITAQGKEKLSLLKTKVARNIPSRKYVSTRSTAWTIVAFDIPEQERKKRNWLRQTIIHLGFTMIQKSVWMGKVVLPEEFLDDLSGLHMMDYVQIFEITKSGTLIRHKD
ncbi:MAG: CRISPR-associated endonuclease Cas2 [bacterium]|nr:CRISPR-associated endonuclease Cas2 [bacterium]